MNEKDAREIVRGPRCFPVDELFGRAEGYLEAIEKAKELEEALREISALDFPDLNHKQFQIVCILDEALAKWVKEK